ncbi:MAG: cation diffusion facilitator family transporter [Candidatus Eisenbacteria bacterium]|nr:cation diffusion facilitator family transporter [Candidatus Eisenbacteria bacterium]
MTTLIRNTPAMPPITGRNPLAMRRVYASAERGALLGFVVNILLAAGKLTAGILAGSFVLIADAVNSLGDVLASTVVLGSLRFAQRPPDAGHPYGHTRIEAVAGAMVSMLILVSAGIIAWEAIQRIGRFHDVPPSWTLWVAGTTVVTKEVLYRYNWRLGKETGSQAIRANAWDHRADALSALAVMVGLALVRFGGDSWRSADEIAALVVVVLILTGGVRLLLGSAHELMDAQAEPDFVGRIRRMVLTVPGADGVEKLFVRKSGLEYLVDLHLEVDPAMTVESGHRVSHAVKDHLMAECAEIREVLIHLEPARTHRG